MPKLKRGLDPESHLLYCFSYVRSTLSFDWWSNNIDALSKIPQCRVALQPVVMLLPPNITTGLGYRPLLCPLLDKAPPAKSYSTPYALLSRANV